MLTFAGLGRRLASVHQTLQRRANPSARFASISPGCGNSRICRQAWCSFYHLLISSPTTVMTAAGGAWRQGFWLFCDPIDTLLGDSDHGLALQDRPWWRSLHSNRLIVHGCPTSPLKLVLSLAAHVVTSRRFWRNQLAASSAIAASATSGIFLEVSWKAIHGFQLDESASGADFFSAVWHSMALQKMCLAQDKTFTNGRADTPPTSPGSLSTSVLLP